MSTSIWVYEEHISQNPIKSKEMYLNKVIDFYKKRPVLETYLVSFRKTKERTNVREALAS